MSAPGGDHPKFRSCNDDTRARLTPRPRTGPLYCTDLPPRAAADMVALSRTADPTRCRELVQRDGAAILTGLKTHCSSGVRSLGATVFGTDAAVQQPVHVGTNNIGFRKGRDLSTLELRPAHTDTINDYSPTQYAPRPATTSLPARRLAHYPAQRRLPSSLVVACAGHRITFSCAVSVLAQSVVTLFSSISSSA